MKQDVYNTIFQADCHEFMYCLKRVTARSVCSLYMTDLLEILYEIVLQIISYTIFCMCGVIIHNNHCHHLCIITIIR